MQRPFQQAWSFLTVDNEVDCRREGIAPPADERFSDTGFKRGRKSTSIRQRHWQVERQKPALIVRFECRYVAVGLAPGFDDGRLVRPLQGVCLAAPGLTVVVVEHGAAPVEL